MINNIQDLIIKGKPSEEENIKEQSNYLRGTIVNDIKNKLTGSFDEKNSFLIRFHGMYQQDNRDIRKERNIQLLEPNYSMMLRVRIPGGRITPKQWLAIDEFCDEYTLYKNIRITDRQTLQIHGILKKNVKLIHKILHKVELDSFATANDGNRNVICSTNPNIKSDLQEIIYLFSKKISDYLLPKTNAYSEIWLDKKINTEDHEPILGKTYLPRKFKISIVVPPYNDVDLHANDLNFIAIVKDNQLIGFNLLIGGGLSIEHNNKLTYARLASEIGYFHVDKLFEVTKAVVTIQRDFGNRVNRKNAKTKYTIDRLGINFFKKEIEKRALLKFEKIKSYQLSMRYDDIGWVKNDKKEWYFTLFVENGRIMNKNNYELKNGIKEIAKIHKSFFYLTTNQNLIFAKIDNNEKSKINEILNYYSLTKEISAQKKNSMACVSFPTCPLAMSEAERFLPSFIKKIEKILYKCNLGNDYITLRISGCPNGCARALLSEIGLIGKSLNYYNLYIGGNRLGTRIPRLYKENINEKEIINILEKLIILWSKNRNFNEIFGDFVIRTKIVKPVINSTYDFW
ncbi:assimilatory sulfite reductase (NADPH) hemoprotein subunit [Candidatus Tachikawaea gelatinosa]|uniref:assimilatory sulfite reductase (NADPH) n=1 Tax=Candidatus Tachikawaea gelatinosa TaxID=1410383 RepID=A0A090AJC4_9ENTR|nr:assimilatory sulfite reductase (NADPH) hemoprotein subunit [Candidatus Tachikawaea gelatinosa]BAP58543.1 sulfite reductase [NADPH] hemoprotein beta-component [Candidatus Tachikawaea gelatinosa]